MSNWKVRSDDWTTAENQNGSSLTHYGVKGMRWGVRKELDKSGSKTMRTMAEKYKGKIATKKQNGKPFSTLSFENINGKIEPVERFHQYNSKTGKVENIGFRKGGYRHGKDQEWFITDDHSEQQISDFKEAVSEETEYYYNKMPDGKNRTYIDEDGNIWQWDSRKGDYVKLGGTKGKMKETMSYKVSKIGKKIGDAVNKAVEAGKNFLSKLFNVKSGTKTTTRGTDKPKTNTKTNSKTTSGINAYVPKNAKLQPTKRYKDIDDWRRKNRR